MIEACNIQIWPRIGSTLVMSPPPNLSHQVGLDRSHPEDTQVPLENFKQAKNGIKGLNFQVPHDYQTALI